MNIDKPQLEFTIARADNGFITVQVFDGLAVNNETRVKIFNKGVDVVEEIQKLVAQFVESYK